MSTPTDVTTDTTVVPDATVDTTVEDAAVPDGTTADSTAAGKNLPDWAIVLIVLGGILIIVIGVAVHRHRRDSGMLQALIAERDAEANRLYQNQALDNMAQQMRRQMWQYTPTDYDSTA